MNRSLGHGLLTLAVVAVGLAAFPAPAAIDGVTGTTFNLVAGTNRITTPDGSNILVWGYGCPLCADGPKVPQFPGPTLILNQGDTVTVTLQNTLTVPPPPPATVALPGPNVSIVFQGMDMVSVTGGVSGNVTNEAVAGTGAAGQVTYVFKASNPGTYMYHSGTREDLEIEMGLVGALIVRPTGFPGEPGQAYYHPSTAFDREYLFVIQEMDPAIHTLVDTGSIAQVDNTHWWPVYWFFNGRAAPDTLAEAWPITAWMPSQPYNCAPRMHPGENVLLRTVSAGRELHPFHHHGNHSRVIAKEGRLLESAPGAGPDLSYLIYSVFSVPGETTDSIFSWTGQGLGWDFYGHKPSDPLQPAECVFNGVQDTSNPLCDHGKPIPVTLPSLLALEFGEFWGGSPYLGVLGALPPGQGRNNTTGGYFFMWHSHTEKEIVNNNIFPGGMMTMGVVEAPSVPIQ